MEQSTDYGTEKRLVLYSKKKPLPFCPKGWEIVSNESPSEVDGNEIQGRIVLEKIKYGFTRKHDAVLDLCIAQFGTCQFNCAKDGAPNCFYHVAQRECAPSKIER